MTGARVSVRPLTESDDFAALNADNPSGWLADWWRDLDAGAEPRVSWFVGELDGVGVGFGAALPLPLARGGYGVGIVFVRPEHRRHGLGSALLGAVEGVLREAGLPGLQLSWTEGQIAGEAAAAAWGLRETARHRESVLDLTAIDRDAYAARAAAPGVTLAILPDEMSEDEWRELHSFTHARFAETPDAADGGAGPPYEAFRGMVTEPWTLVTASRDDQRLGLTAVTRRGSTGDTVNTFFTGVVAEARGQGIASALKCHHALLLADRGLTRLYTQNMDGNEPILAANRTLGFVPARGYADVVRDF